MAMVYPANPPNNKSPMIANTPNISIMERPDCELRKSEEWDAKRSPPKRFLKSEKM